MGIMVVEQSSKHFVSRIWNSASTEQQLPISLIPLPQSLETTVPLSVSLNLTTFRNFMQVESDTIYSYATGLFHVA